MPKHSYKSEEQQRIAATFSISDNRQQVFRKALALELGHIPSRRECERAMRKIAQQAIDDYIKLAVHLESRPS